jgi:hypothetical protein
MNGIVSPGFTAATLIDCMAAMPWAGGSCRNADITNYENA